MKPRTTTLRRLLTILALTLTVGAVVLPAVACQDSPSENMQDAGDNLKDAAEDIGDAAKGAAENTKDAVHDAAENTGDAIEDATD